jgi:predicted DNA-binding transcriptional regulator AlpA
MPDTGQPAGRASVASNAGAHAMTSKASLEIGAQPFKGPVQAMVLLTPKEAARLLKMSVSWLAKARMRGDGPPFIRVGRSIRYSEAALVQWMKARQRLSTSGL